MHEHRRSWIRWEASFAGESVVGLVLRLFQCFKYAYVVSCFVCFFYELLSRGRRSRPEVFCKKGVLRNLANSTGKHLCQSLYFNKVAGLSPQAYNVIKIETLAQVFFSEFCQISKNTFSHRTPPVAASATAYSEPCQKFKMELFAKIVHDWKSLTIFTKLQLRCLAGLWIRLCWIQGKVLAHVCYMLKYITCLE